MRSLNSFIGHALNTNLILPDKNDESVSVIVETGNKIGNEKQLSQKNIIKYNNKTLVILCCTQTIQQLELFNYNMRIVLPVCLATPHLVHQCYGWFLIVGLIYQVQKTIVTSFSQVKDGSVPEVPVGTFSPIELSTSNWFKAQAKAATTHHEVILRWNFNTKK